MSACESQQFSSMEEYSSNILKILGQPTRMKIMQLLGEKALCVSEIHRGIGEEQSNTSHHLSLMHAHGILHREKRELKTFYKVKDPALLEIVRLAQRTVAQESARRVELRPRPIGGKQAGLF